MRRASLLNCRFFAVFALIGCLAFTQISRGDCTPGWKPNTDLAGLSGSVYSLVTWDPDGPGPKPEVLLAGGSFFAAGGRAAPGIAMFDGATWHPLGTGIQGTTFVVDDLVVYRGEVIACGEFPSAGNVPGTANIAAWDGVQWKSLGGGLSAPARALVVRDDKLFVAGSFLQAGAIASKCVASWNGSEWARYDTGMAQGLNALADLDGTLVAAGWAFADSRLLVYRHGGASWQQMGSNMAGAAGFGAAVRCFGRYHGTLYAGGAFYQPGACLVKWNGNDWVSADFYFGNGYSHTVYTLAAYRDRLIVGGRGLRLPSVASGIGGIGVFDGTNWSGFSNGSSNSEIQAIAVFRGDLILGGTSYYGGLTIFLQRFGCPTCTGDLNYDERIDDSDFVEFVAAYDTMACSDPSMIPGCPADLDSSAMVDDDDFQLFVTSYNAMFCN